METKCIAGIAQVNMIDKLYKVVQVFNELISCSPDLAKVKWIDCEILFKIYFYVYV